MRRIVVHGHYGMRNTGDDAMLWAVLGELRRIENDSIIYVIAGPSFDQRMLRELEIKIAPRAAISLAKLIPGSTKLIIGGGTHLHSRKGKWRYLEDSLNQLLILLYARFFGCKCEMVGVGFGKFETKVGELVAKMCCRLCTYVSVRDSASLRWLRWSDGRLKIKKTVDPVYFLNLSTVERVPGRLVISAMPYFANYESQLPDNDSVFIEGIAEIVAEWLQLSEDTTVSLVVFNAKPCSDNDELVLGPLYARFDMEDRVSMVRYSPDPYLAIREFQKSSFAVVTRYHSAVFAHLAELPMVSVNYHQKNIAFCREIELPEAAQLDPKDIAPGKVRGLAKLLYQSPKDFTPRKSPRDYIMEASSLFEL